MPLGRPDRRPFFLCRTSARRGRTPDANAIARPSPSERPLLRAPSPAPSVRRVCYRQSVDDLPHEVTLVMAVRDATSGSAPAEHDPVRQVRVEGGVVDLADDWRQLRYLQRDGRLVIEAPG